jgi:hypothetical protein
MIGSIRAATAPAGSGPANAFALIGAWAMAVSQSAPVTRQIQEGLPTMGGLRRAGLTLKSGGLGSALIGGAHGAENRNPACRFPMSGRSTSNCGARATGDQGSPLEWFPATDDMFVRDRAGT